MGLDSWCLVSLLGVGVVSAVRIDTQGLALMHKRLSYGNHWHRGLLGNYGRDIRREQLSQENNQFQENNGISVLGNSTMTKERFSFSKPTIYDSKSLLKKKMVRYVKSRSSQAVKRTARRVLKRKVKINRKSLKNVGILSNLTLSSPRGGDTNIIESLNR